MSQPEITEALQRELGRLFLESLKISSSLYQVHLIREKLSQRGYQAFDREDILEEMAGIQQVIGNLSGRMLQIYGLLKGLQE